MENFDFVYRTHLRSFKSPTLGRMKHLDIKHRVKDQGLFPRSFIPTPQES
jgi:hypothetical protein